MEYDVEDYLKSCIERYKELTGVTQLRKASTPFLPEPTKPDFKHETGPEVEPTPDEALQAAVCGITAGGGGALRDVAAGKPSKGHDDDDPDDHDHDCNNPKPRTAPATSTTT